MESLALALLGHVDHIALGKADGLEFRNRFLDVHLSIFEHHSD